MPKISELTEMSTGEMDLTNVLPIVIDMSGTPLSRRIAFSNLLAAVRYQPIYLKVFDHETEVSSGDGKMYWVVTDEFDGATITDINLYVPVKGASGATAVDIYNVTDAQSVAPVDGASLAYNYFSTYDSGDTVTIANGALSAGDRIRIDVDSVAPGAKGLDVIITVDML
jgi:hypothetical protein